MVPGGWGVGGVVVHVIQGRGGGFYVLIWGALLDAVLCHGVMCFVVMCCAVVKWLHGLLNVSISGVCHLCASA